VPKPPCARCGAKQSHSIHIRALGMAGNHPYEDGSRAGLSPIGEARERFNASERGREYNAVTRALAAGEVACQIQSPVCTGLAEHQDEALTRGRAGGLAAALRDGPEPSLACDACNTYLAENLVWASEHGFARLKAKR